MKHKIEPINQEVEFGFEEILFSLTDKKGVIVDSNNVFIKVSGYQKEELISKPHNIVRHPDMPKCIFELFWKKIQADQPIVAYVKNMNKEGKFYWILSTVIPIKDGYLSIRIKPQSSFLNMIKEFYPILLEKEKKDGIKAASVLLMEKLLQHNFETYESFMVRALSNEILANKKLIQLSPLNTEGLGIKNPVYKEISRSFGKNSKQFNVVLDKVKSIIEFAPNLKSKTDSILLSCNKLDYISLNMSINSGNLGQETASVSIISREFQSMVSIIRGLVKKFQDNSIKLRSEIETIEFESMYSFLQIKTIELFFNEFFNMEKDNDGEPTDNSEGSRKNLRILFAQLIQSINLNAIKALEKSSSSCKGLLDISNLLKGKIFSLEITKDLSKIEISRNKRIEGYFDNQIQDIQNFISGNKDNIGNIQEMTSAAANEIKNIIDSMKEINNYINSVNKKLQN
ncbi:PAS domain-containing protein [Silvanigrella sp.]|jgi:PAS domain S-box-containing protein|uniref:PAS domain-containing protein n=1 Tax=Silvanigrella sp. TaxID=2024976 RepID=UPI0037C5C3E9